MAYENIPGVYSKIDASAAVQALNANDAVIGIIATGSLGDINKAYAPSSHEDAKTVYGVDSNIEKLMKTAIDNGGNKFIVVRANAPKEIAELTITAGATTASNVTVTLNSIVITVAVNGTDTINQVATAIRAATFAGWTVTGSGAKAIFTSTTDGVKVDASYSEGTTGATGTIVTTTQGGATTDYQAALDILELEEAVSIVIIDSVDSAVHVKLKTHCINASDNRRERVAFIGYAIGTDINTAKLAAEAINSGLLYIAYPNPLDINGTEVDGIFTAAAMAGVDSAEIDPSMPMTNVQVKGFYGLAKKLKDSEQSSLIDSGVIPLEIRNGDIRVVRMISTYTKDALAANDITWQERTTVKITHYIFKDLRNDLARRFSRSKQNVKARDSVKTAVVNRLKVYEGLEYIENVSDSDITIKINASVPTKNDVDFKYDVVTPMNVISLTGHLVI